MPIRVDAYISEGVAKGVLAREGHVRDALEQAGALPLAGVQWQAFDSTARPAADMSIPSDDVLIVICDDDPSVPVHAQWHGIRLEVGPYTLEGEMPTLPGFDPGRALTRPSGEFIQLRDVSIGLRSDSGPGAPLTPVGHIALVNRYTVESVACDLMLGFFFPGAAMVQQEVAETGAP